MSGFNIRGNKMNKSFLGITLLGLSVTTAVAEPIDFAAILLGQDGKPVTECIRLNSDRTKCDEEVTLTLGWLSRFALDFTEDRAPPLPLSDVVKRGILSEKIKANSKLDLSVDEAKLVKDQILKLSYKTSIKFQAIKLVDPKGAE